METDILISGGGPAGSVLAVAAAQAGWRVTVVESGPPQAPVADDPRHIALSAASVRICSALGLWPALAPHAQAVQRVEVSQAGHFGTLKFSAGDLGLEALGQVLPAGPLFTAMQASARLQAGVDWQAPARIACASSSATHVEAQLEDGRRWQASLLVVAEGAQSALREALGFQAEAVAFGQTALLCTLQGGLPHGGASWQRLTADGPIAILPLRAAARAVVCTLPEAQAAGDELLRLRRDRAHVQSGLVRERARAHVRLERVRHEVHDRLLRRDLSAHAARVGAGVLGGMMYRRHIQTPRGREQYDRLLLRIPLAGRVAKMVAISRFTRTLATLLASGVPLLTALEIVQQVVGNKVLEEAIQGARGNIREGQSIADPLKRSGLFPPLVTHMIAIGEKSGELEGMLQKVSEAYDNEVETVVTGMTSLLAPLMILGMGGVVLFIVLAILLPIFEVSQIVK